MRTNARRTRRNFSSRTMPKKGMVFSGNKYRGKYYGKAQKGKTTFNPSQFINKNPVDVEVEEYTPTHTFETIGIDKRLVASLKKLGIDVPTPIQDQIIPEILLGHDVVGLAETGTGKTAAFLLPLIHRVLEGKQQCTLVLAPTRELAIQIQKELQGLTRGMRIHSTICVGGMNIRPQLQSLRKQSQFIIGTPGRVQDLIERKAIKTQTINGVVLDEADRMLDMGFIGDMRKILSGITGDRITLFFSATMPLEAEKLVGEFLRNPVRISVKKKATANSIMQDVVYYPREKKFEKLVSLLEDKACSRAIVFGEMKHSVERLARQLVKHGIRAESIHGNKTHNQRQRALTKFKNGEVSVLVATDVAARGIHVDDISHVINYELPSTFEDYVHRIGRTGRANKRGKALTFIQQ